MKKDENFDEIFFDCETYLHSLIKVKRIVKFLKEVDCIFCIVKFIKQTFIGRSLLKEKCCIIF